MNILKGIMKFRDLGAGSWELATKEGEHYEIIGGDDALYKEGKKAVLKGRIRKDLMSAGNFGPIFEVDSVEPE